MPSTPGVAAAWVPVAGAASSSVTGVQATSAKVSASATAVPARGNDFMGNSSEDVEQLDIEGQGGVGADRAAGRATGAVGKRAGDPEPVPRAHGHERHA